MKLSRLLAKLPQHELLSRPAAARPPNSSALPAIDITGITADSRQVEPGSLFVAYRGVQLDGHRFVPDALARGAAAVVVETPFDLRNIKSSALFIGVPNGREALAYLAAGWHNHPSKKLAMVGVTGTDGKTTTINFLHRMLLSGGKNVGMISTVNAVIGAREMDTGLHTTTPDAPDVQRYLAEMVRNGAEICLLETTSHGLAHHRVTACNFDIAIVTNISHEHLDLHGSLDAYRAAKALLFESLAGAAGKGFPKSAVLNCDDWSFEYLKKKSGAQKYQLAGIQFDRPS